MEWSTQERPAPQRSTEHLPRNAWEVGTYMPTVSELVNKVAELPGVSSTVYDFSFKLESSL